MSRLLIATAAFVACTALSVGAWPGTPSAFAGDRAPTTSTTSKRPAPATTADTSGADNSDAQQTRSTKPIRLYGLTWNRGVEATVAAAEKAQRPALLVRILGELDGAI